MLFNLEKEIKIMGLTTNLTNKLLGHVFKNEEYPSPSNIYVGLNTEDGEVDGDGYERQEIVFGTASNGSIKNDDEVVFDIAEEDWGEVISASLYDSESGGDELDIAEITSSRTVRENDQFSIPSGNYTIEVE